MSSSEDESETHLGLGGRARKRKLGKESAMLGIFGSDDDTKPGRQDLRYKGVSFAPSHSEIDGPERIPDMSVDSDSQEEGQGSQESQETEERPSFGMNSFGMNSFGMNNFGLQDDSSARDSERPDDEGSDLETPGLGSKENQRMSGSDTPDPSRFDSPGFTPSSFKSSRQDRVQRGTKPSTASPAPAAHVNRKLTSTYGIGAKLMAQMGYVAGTGLGTEGKGIVNPIEQSLRPSGLGLGGVSERPSRSASEEPKSRKQKPVSKSSQGTPRRATTVTEVLQELRNQGSLAIPSELSEIAAYYDNKILDEESHQSSSSQTPQELVSHIENINSSLRGVTGRQKYLQFEIKRLESQLDDVLLQISTLKQIISSCEDLSDQSSVDNLSDNLAQLQFEYIKEVKTYRLDEVAIAAIHPLFQQGVNQWNPLHDPTYFRENLVKLKVILGLEEPANDHKSYTSRSTASLFDSMIYSIWFSKVKKVLETDWNFHHPASVILLLEEWDSILPKFVKSLLIQDVIMPRIENSISSWTPSKSSSLPSSWIFPWFPYVDDDIRESVVSKVQQRFSNLLDSWKPVYDPFIIDALTVWKELFGDSDMQSMLETHLIPRLVNYVGRDFKVDPSNQSNVPLDPIIHWSRLLKPTTVGSLLSRVFFPQWLDVLHQWLKSKDANFDDISEWYQSWYEWFPSEIIQIPLVNREFRKGLDLIDNASRMESSTRHRLERPKAEKYVQARHDVPSSKPNGSRPVLKSSVPVEASFKDVVEEYCADHDLFFLPLRKAHATLGYPLYKISASVTGYGGLQCYIEDDVLWMQSRNERTKYEPVSVEEIEGLIEQAS